MADTDEKFELTTASQSDNLHLLSARIEEGLSRLPETVVEFLLPVGEMTPEDWLEEAMDVAFDAGEERSETRHFRGTCIAATELRDVWLPSEKRQYTHFEVKLQPTVWKMTQDLDCRIFQEMTVPDIIMEVAREFGLENALQKKLQNTYLERTYCVQYRESSFAFISRLMEQEGIYYFFDHAEDGPIMVLCDDISCHEAVPGHDTVQIREPEEAQRQLTDHIFSWNQKRRSVSLAVTLQDYDFEKSATDLTARKTAPNSGGKKVPAIERYDYPGIHKTADLGTDRSLTRQTARGARLNESSGACNVRALAVGQNLTLEDAVGGSSEFTVTAAEYKLFGLKHAEVEDQIDEAGVSREGGYYCTFRAIPADTRFAKVATTPIPTIPGLQTAVVVGKSGEEIFTDEFGRIKVQFHWDRDGEKDENASCWVRSVVPWSGKSWGMIALPRVGQEVVIQFEDGNPDRPICTGMLYNDAHTPPYSLPDNKTQSGLKTNSSKGGGGFHELVFEDKKDSEFVRFQSERDYMQIVKNNAEITIGMEHQDSGDLTETIYRHKTQTLETGNHTYTIKDGEQTVKIKKDKTETVEGKDTLTVTGDIANTSKNGNISVDAKSGKIAIKAMQEIKLSVGGSSITIDMSGITIKGPTVTVQGDIAADVKAPMTTVNANGILTLKGSLTMIN